MAESNKKDTLRLFGVTIDVSSTKKLDPFKLLGVSIDVSTTCDDHARVCNVATEKGKKRKKRKSWRSSSSSSPTISSKRPRSRSNLAIYDISDNSQTPSLDEIPGLAEAILSDNGTSPVFLYQKTLQASDVKLSQNRLFLTNSGKLMEFLSQEERDAVGNSDKGFEFAAIDPQRSRYKLCLVFWPSLKINVINRKWKQLVTANNAQKGDKVQMWGYRQQHNGKLCLAINFKGTQEEPQAHSKL